MHWHWHWHSAQFQRLRPALFLPGPSSLRQVAMSAPDIAEVRRAFMREKRSQLTTLLSGALHAQDDKSFNKRSRSIPPE